MKNFKKLFEEAEQKYKSYLKLRSMFYTKERKTILDCVLKRQDHFSADELFLDIQTQKIRVSRATIYRCLHQMVECGILFEADFGHGHAHYEVAHEGDTHIHLICTRTGTVKEVQDKELDVLIAKIAKKENLDLKHQKIQLFGELK